MIVNTNESIGSCDWAVAWRYGVVQSSSLMHLKSINLDVEYAIIVDLETVN